MPTKHKLTTEQLILIGFCQPKFYRRHVWLKAKAIMEWLCDHTPHVVRFDYGRGMGKYDSTAELGDLATTANALAKLYDAHRQQEGDCNRHKRTNKRETFNVTAE